MQEGVYVPTTGNNEWAGVPFRADNEDNYWEAYYNEGDDTIKIRQMRGGTYQTPVATSGTLGYGPAMWIYIRVEARLSKFTVYHSSDGATWTLACEYTDTTNSFERAAYMEGYVGHSGYGYSDKDTEPTEPPSYTPPPPYSGTDSGARIFGTNVGIVVTTLITKASPHYYTVNTGLVTSADLNIRAIAWNPDNYEDLLAFTESGLWVHEGFPSGSWQQLATSTAICAGASLSDSIGIGDMRCSIEGPYVLVTFTGYYDDAVWGTVRSWPGIVINRNTGAVVYGSKIINANSNYWGRARCTWAQHGGAQIAYVVTPESYAMGWKGARVYKTINQAQSWSYKANLGSYYYPSITIPYDNDGNTSDQYGYASGTSIYKTITSGETWTELLAMEARKVGTGGHHNYIWVLAPSGGTSRYSENAGVSWTELPSGSGGGESNAVWKNGQLKRVVIGNGATINLWDRGWSSVEDRTGDLAGSTGATSITCIERFGEDLF